MITVATIPSGQFGVGGSTLHCEVLIVLIGFVVGGR